MKELMLDGDWVSSDEVCCNYCGQSIEDNGGYMAIFNGEYVCASDNSSAQCWWECIENYAEDIIDLKYLERDELAREIKEKKNG
jgi:hypothetical protein|tara:strand:- start:402 stop:653 length:252 start_codon:yes stop_codon:yes gene_type:complete